MKREKIMIVVIVIMLVVLIFMRLKQINEAGRKCDIEMDYTCSSYEVQEFMRRK